MGGNSPSKNSKEVSEETVEWRSFDIKNSWTQESVDKLRTEISQIRFPEKKNVDKGKIVLVGPIKSGKSSFINSTLSVISQELTAKTVEGDAEHSVTKAHIQVETNNMIVSDTMGLELDKENGISMDDLKLVLGGKTPKNYEFDPRCPLKEGKKDTSIADEVHCVVLCLDATYVEATHPLLKIMKEIREHLSKLNLQNILILTKIDRLSASVDRDVTTTLMDSKVCTAVKKASEVLGMPERFIFPVKNLTKEVYVPPGVSFLILLAVKQALKIACNFVEEREMDG